MMVEYVKYLYEFEYLFIFIIYMFYIKKVCNLIMITNNLSKYILFNIYNLKIIVGVSFYHCKINIKKMLVILLVDI